MTVKVAGFWERGWDTPWQEFNWWKHPLSEFQIDQFYMSPVTGIDKSYVTEFGDINEIISANSDLTHVYIDENATTTLPDFAHPANALYILGRTSYSSYAVSFREGIDLAVKIPSINNSGGFWGHQAATIVLYDRYIKGL